MLDPVKRQVIKVTHEEVEALLTLFNHIEECELTRDYPLNEVEQSAKDKLKRIYARQILSHEKRKREYNDAANSNIE